MHDPPRDIDKGHSTPSSVEAQLSSSLPPKRSSVPASLKDQGQCGSLNYVDLQVFIGFVRNMILKIQLPVSGTLTSSASAPNTEPTRVRSKSGVATSRTPFDSAGLSTPRGSTEPQDTSGDEDGSYAQLKPRFSTLSWSFLRPLLVACLRLFHLVRWL